MKGAPLESTCCNAIAALLFSSCPDACGILPLAESAELFSVQVLLTFAAINFLFLLASGIT